MESGIKKPRHNDILSGRGNGINNHIGNERYRSLVKGVKTDYVKTPRTHRAEFALKIYEDIKKWNPPGRFLKKNQTTQLWEELEKDKALNKIKQALREGAPIISKAIIKCEELYAMKIPSTVNHGGTHLNETKKKRSFNQVTSEPQLYSPPTKNLDSVIVPEKQMNSSTHTSITPRIEHGDLLKYPDTGEIHGDIAISNNMVPNLKHPDPGVLHGDIKLSNNVAFNLKHQDSGDINPSVLTNSIVSNLKHQDSGDISTSVPSNNVAPNLRQSCPGNINPSIRRAGDESVTSAIKRRSVAIINTKVRTLPGINFEGVVGDGSHVRNDSMDFDELLKDSNEDGMSSQKESSDELSDLTCMMNSNMNMSISAKSFSNSSTKRSSRSQPDAENSHSNSLGLSGLSDYFSKGELHDIMSTDDSDLNFSLNLEGLDGTLKEEDDSS